MPVDARRPFTEMVEVAQNELVREAASNQEAKFKGLILQQYQHDLPDLLAERFIRKEAFITLAAQYTTGTVTVGTGTAGVIGSSTSWTSTHTNYWIKVSGFDRLYRVTFSDDTLLTFQNSLAWTESSGSGLSYVLFQDRYALPSDFAFMAKDDPEDPNVVSRFVSNAPLFLSPLNNDEFDRDFNGIVGDLWSYTVKWVSALPYLLTLSAPSVADTLRYYYIPVLSDLTEYTTGTVTFTTGTAVVASSAALWTANVDTSANTFYIRNDADGTGSASKWFKILTVANNTALTLSSAFSGTSGASQTYTISAISKWPARFDDVIMYGACLIADPDNTQAAKWARVLQNGIDMDRKTESNRDKYKPIKEFFGLRKKT